MMYCIFDRVANLYGVPFTSTNNQTAIREFATACQQEGSQFNLYADDFFLYYCGAWDEHEAIFINTGDDSLKRLASAREFVLRYSEEEKGVSDEV